MELLSKKFQDGIRQIPECDWLDKSYEIEKKLNDDSPFNAAKCVGFFVSSCLCQIYIGEGTQPFTFL